MPYHKFVLQDAPVSKTVHYMPWEPAVGGALKPNACWVCWTMQFFKMLAHASNDRGYSLWRTNHLILLLCGLMFWCLLFQLLVTLSIAIACCLNSSFCFVSVTLIRQQHGRIQGRPSFLRWMLQLPQVLRCNRASWIQQLVRRNQQNLQWRCVKQFSISQWKVMRCWSAVCHYNICFSS